MAITVSLLFTAAGATLIWAVDAGTGVFGGPRRTDGRDTTTIVH